MPIWTDGEDDAIASLSSTEFTDKALFGERYASGGLELKGHNLEGHLVEDSM